MSKASKRRDAIWRIIQNQIEALLPTDSTFTCATVESLVKLQEQACSAFYNATRCKDPVRVAAPKFAVGRKVRIRNRSGDRRGKITKVYTRYSVEGQGTSWNDDELELVED